MSTTGMEVGGLNFTAKEQYRLNACYANIKAALDELAQVKNKDRELIHIQHQFYVIEDTLHQYVGPYKEGK